MARRNTAARADAARFSALGLQRLLGLGSYQTAWSWLHRLRRAMVCPGRDDYLEQSKSTRHSGEASTLGNGAEEQVGKPLSL